MDPLLWELLAKVRYVNFAVEKEGRDGMKREVTDMCAQRQCMEGTPADMHACTPAACARLWTSAVAFTLATTLAIAFRPDCRLYPVLTCK